MQTKLYRYIINKNFTYKVIKFKKKKNIFFFFGGTMFCNNCGKEVSDNLTFCPECGNQLSSSAITNNSSQQQNSKKNCKLFYF